MAKLHFKKIRSRNFRSIGTHFMEIDLDKGSTLVFSNENGAGKSTGLLYAITYVLFDKSYKKGQKKTSLLNSANNKDCVVEVEFKTKGSEWLVRRGMKPNLFDIIRDGVRITDEAAKGDYQAYLQGVLGFDDKVFHNVVALGRDKFVPFNELDASQSRNLGEVMLDQGVFSRANEITKEDLKAKTREISDLGYEIDKTKSRIQSSERVLDALRSSLASKNTDKQGLIDHNADELAGVKAKLDLATKVLSATQAKADELHKARNEDFPADLAQQFDKMNTMLIQLRSKKSAAENTKGRFTSMTTCPTCEQEVSDERKKQVSDKFDPEIATLDGGITKLSAMHADLQAKLSSYKEATNEANEMTSKVNVLREGVNGLQREANNIQSLIDSLQASMAKATDTSMEATKIAEEELTLVSAKTELAAQQEAEKVALKAKADTTALLTFLKDDGFKAEITKLYIPMLNQKVNEFLDAMNLFVSIVIDQEFNMTMVSPDRKNQTIADLSTGQTCRIDLGMLLGWREVAATKSSVDTNLLIMDETLENLSPQGVSDFVEYINLKHPEGMNLFIITQRGAEFSEYFDNTIEYALKDGFTTRVV